MRSYRVDTISKYLSPTSGDWARLKPARVTLVPTPLPMQPTAYVRNAWVGKKYGETPFVDVASVHDGETWAVRLSWTTLEPKGSVDFPDAVAVALPISPRAILALMGSAEDPIQFLRWDSRNTKAARSVIAGGLGNSAPGPDVKQTAQASGKPGEWQVVLARALGSSRDVAPLAAGAKTGVGFAVWRGANDERAGIKAFSADWTALELDA